MTRFSAQPSCASRARYPANEAEARAVAFIVEARTRAAPLAFADLVALLEQNHPGLGRGPRGRWSRYLVQRIAKRAGVPKASAAPTPRTPAAPVPNPSEARPGPVRSFERVDWARLARAFGV